MALLNIARNNKKIQKITEIKDVNLLDLRNNVKVAYMDDSVLIREILKQSDYIINDWENEIEGLNKDIDDIVQIYLKAEWIRCKIETRMWPFSRYNEEKVVNKLQKEYKENSKKYAGFKV